MYPLQSLLSSYDPKPLIDYLSPVGLFWLGTHAGQRLGGGLLGRYFGGPRGTITGLAVVAASSVATQKIKTEFIDPWLGKPRSRQRVPTGELIHRTYLSMMCFMLLGMKSFDSVLPSSVITLGSFAKTRSIPLWTKGAVDTDSHVASSSERARIQRLGKAYGCHHCGSKQSFTAKSFIADHMPPTMQVKQMNKAWWRKILGIKVNISYIIILMVPLIWLVFIHEYLIIFTSLGKTGFVASVSELFQPPGPCCSHEPARAHIQPEA
jgi:hypothetical protein